MVVRVLHSGRSCYESSETMLFVSRRIYDQFLVVIIMKLVHSPSSLPTALLCLLFKKVSPDVHGGWRLKGSKILDSPYLSWHVTQSGAIGERRADGKDEIKPSVRERKPRRRVILFAHRCPRRPRPFILHSPGLSSPFTMFSRQAASTLRSSQALAASRSRLFSSSVPRQTKVAVLGASGGIGQPLSLLLKLDPLVSNLSLYDIRLAPGVAADVSHVDAPGEVRVFYARGARVFV
jgi:hypothetical protein